MDQSKDNTFIVPATVYFTEEGTLSVDLKILDNDDSKLRQMLDGKTVDERRSVVGVFCKDFLNKYSLTSTFIMFSGMFNFVDTATYITPETVDHRVIKALATTLVDEGCGCKYCARHEQCNMEAAQCDNWQVPDTAICAREVRKYFHNKVKNG